MAGIGNSLLSNFGEVPSGAQMANSAWLATNARLASSLGRAAGLAGSAPGLAGSPSGGILGAGSGLLGAKAGAGASAADDSFESRLKSAMTAKDEAKLKDACMQFEELMLGLVYKQMKATVQRSTLTDKDPGRDVYEQWQDDQMMKELAKNGSFGLADMMFKQLSRRMRNAYILDEDAY
jgi:flagellar protein FlgJ